MKTLTKIFILGLLTALMLTNFSVLNDQHSAQASALASDDMAQNAQEGTEFKQYIPIVYKASIVPIGPVGGSITSVLIDPVDNNIVYAGSYGGGVLKSVDKGTTWFRSSAGIPPEGMAIQSLGLIPSFPNVVFAGTNGNGLYRSTDYGESWTKVGAAFGTNAVYEFAFDPRNPNVIYTVTRITNINVCQGLRGALYRSEDAGLNWTFLRYGDVAGTCADYWYDVDVSPWNSNTVYLPYHEHGNYRSTDYARTFQPINEGIREYNSILPARSFAFDTITGRTFSGFAKGTSVYVSGNGGNTWQRTLLNGVEVLKVKTAPLAADRQRVILATLDYGVVYSDYSGNGTSWNITTLKDTAPMIYDVAVANKNPNRWYAGSHGKGLFISSDKGKTWVRAGTAIISSYVSSLTSSSELPGAIIAGVYGQGVLTSSDNGENWQALNSGLDSMNIREVYNFGDQLYALTDSGVYQYAESAWQNIGFPQTEEPDLEAYQAYSSKVLPVDTPLVGEMLQANLQTLQSRNNGKKLIGNTPVTELALLGSQLLAGTAGDGLWELQGDTWTQIGFEKQNIASMSFNQDSEQGLLASCQKDQKCVIYNYTEGAWNQSMDGMKAGQVTDLLVTTNGSCYAVVSDELYRSQKIGGTWEIVAETGKKLRSIFSSDDGAVLVAAGKGGAWFSLDQGKNWQEIYGLEKHLTVQSVLFDRPGSLILGTDAGGAFIYALPEG